MTENTGPMDATGRPMLRFESMDNSKETPADVEVSDRSIAEKMFPSMRPEPKEKSESEIVSEKMLYPEAVPEAAPEVDPELAAYEIGNVQQDYSALDVSEAKLDLSEVDGPTRHHIETIRLHDFEGVVEKLVPELEGMGISQEDLEKYITGPLEAVKRGADPGPYVNYAVRHLLRIHDFRKQAQGGY